MVRKHLVVALGLLALFTGPAAAQASKCSSSKVKLAGKEASAKTKCHGKAVGKGVEVDAECLQKAEEKFQKGWLKAEGKDDCFSTDDAEAIEAKIDAFVVELNEALGSGGPSKCTSKKIQSAGKKVGVKAGCHAKAIGKGIGVDQACLDKAEAKFLTAFTKAEDAEDCIGGTGDAAAVEGEVDSLIDDLLAELTPAGASTTTTSPVPTTTSTTTITTTTAPGPTTTTTTGPVLTTTSTTTTTTTTSPGVSTTTTTISPLCGNGQLNAGETCDDGNNNNNDPCPADCVVDPCTPITGNQPVSVFFQPPAGGNVAGLTVLLDYPEGRVQIPGTGSVQGSISNIPPGAFGSSNDLNHALREVVGAGNTIPPGLLFRVNFQSCQGAPPATAGNYICTVLDASDPFSNPVSGVTCSVTVP